jgi:hypothetical protein
MVVSTRIHIHWLLLAGSLFACSKVRLAWSFHPCSTLDDAYPPPCSRCNSISRRPTFLYAESNRHNNSNNIPTTTRSSNGGGDGTLAVVNRQRVRTAGRKGTKSFVDPTKLFLGNLPFDADEKDVRLFFQENLGTTFNVKSIKIIRDWRNNQSKGYGFALFSDPMFATSAMEVCNGKPLKGRLIRVDQGQKKRDPNELYIQKKKKKEAQLTEEEEAIQAGLDEAEGDDPEDMIALEEFDDISDALLFEDDDDDDEFEYDGVFEDIYPTQYEPLSEEEQKLNREQRRDAAKRKKRRKLPHKGFEPRPDQE